MKNPDKPTFIPKIILNLHDDDGVGGKVSPPLSPQPTGSSHFHYTQRLSQGDHNFTIPDRNTLLKNALERVPKSGKQKLERAEYKGDPDDPAGAAFLRSARRMSNSPSRKRTRTGYSAGEGLLSASDGLQESMMQGQLAGVICSRFEDLEIEVDWALKNYEPAFQPAIKMIDEQLRSLKASYLETLPELISELSCRQPKALAGNLMVLTMEAVRLLDNELAHLIAGLKVYTDCIEQRRKGIYADELSAISLFFQQVHSLFWSGDPEGNTESALLPLGKNERESCGNVCLVRFSRSMNLGTIPAASGAIGADTLQVPVAMRETCTLHFPLFGHEARHNRSYDVRGLLNEMRRLVQTAITEVTESGLVIFSEPNVQIGKQQVQISRVLIKLFADWIGEVDADVNGGVLFSGEAFGFNMLMSFPAISIQGGRVSDAPELLQTTSSYDLVAQKPKASQKSSPDPLPAVAASKATSAVVLKFAPHPPDFVRAYIVAAALDEIGFSEAAGNLRQLANFAVSYHPPVDTIFEFEGEGNAPQIVIKTTDILAVVPAVIKSLIRTPLSSLGGKSNGEMTMWTKRRQQKVDALAEVLLAGGADIPKGIGSVHANYVGAAAVRAYLHAVNTVSGKGSELAEKLNSQAMQMLLQVRETTS